MSAIENRPICGTGRHGRCSAALDAEIATGALDLRVSERTRVIMLIMRIVLVQKGAEIDVRSILSLLRRSRISGRFHCAPG